MPDSLQLANPQNIYERMKTYMVPGLGMSVINNNEVEWSKAYGVMDATLGEEVVNESIFQAPQQVNYSHQFFCYILFRMATLIWMRISMSILSRGEYLRMNLQIMKKLLYEEC